MIFLLLYNTKLRTISSTNIVVLLHIYIHYTYIYDFYTHIFFYSIYLYNVQVRIYRRFSITIYQLAVIPVSHPVNYILLKKNRSFGILCKISEFSTNQKASDVAQSHIGIRFRDYYVKARIQSKSSSFSQNTLPARSSSSSNKKNHTFRSI